jgi:hypothetical protein
LSTERKLVVITSKEMKAVQNGDISALVENMLRLGASVRASGHEVTSIHGPFDNKADGECLFVLNLKKAESNREVL